MPTPHEFLETLAIVLGVAALATVIFQRLRQPVVLGYILAGLLVGPHVPLPLSAHPATVNVLSEGSAGRSRRASTPVARSRSRAPRSSRRCSQT